MTNIATGLRQTNAAGAAAPPYTNGPYTWDQPLTLSGTTIAFSNTASFTGTATFDGTKTAFTGQKIRVVNATTAGKWTHNDTTGDLQLAASLGTAYFAYPLVGLKTGDIITGYQIVGQLGSGGNASLISSELRKAVAAAAAGPTVSTIATATLLSVTSSTQLLTNAGVTGLTTTVTDGDLFIVAGSATTNSGCAVDICYIEVDLTRK